MGASQATLTGNSRRCYVLVLGLDNAGKTSILDAMAEGTSVVSQLVPTKGVTVVPLSYNGFHVNAIDVGGSKLNRQNWPNYFTKAHAVIYVIDCADKAKMEENGLVIEKLLSTPELFRKPFLVLANKQDVFTAASASQVSEGLNLHLTGGRQWQVVPCSARTSLRVLR